MPSPFNLNPASGGADYKKVLAEMMTRYGGDRDRAVRSANVASGFGNSTAERFMHPAAAPAAAPAGAAPIPTPRPDPGTTGAVADVPIPQPRPTQFPPDLAVSPQRPDNMMWQGATGGGAMPGTALPQNAVPPNSAMSLASILRQIPPELLGRLVKGPGQPSAAIGLGMQPTQAMPPNGQRWE